MSIEVRAPLAAGASRTIPAVAMPSGKTALLAQRDVSDADRLNPNCTITTFIEASLDGGANWLPWGSSVVPGDPACDLSQPARLRVRPVPPDGALVRVRYEVSGSAGLADAGMMLQTA